MSKMMIYATTDKAGGNVENVWGHQMLTRSIDSSNKDEVEQAKADGWTNKPQDVIKQIEAQAMKKDNDKMKGQLSGGNDKRVKELEEQLSQALTEIAGLEETVTELKELNAEITMDLSGRDMALKGKDELIAEFKEELSKSSTEVAELTERLAVYEAAKDANQDGKVDYEEMTNAELQKLLDQRKVDYNKRDGKDALIKAAQKSE